VKNLNIVRLANLQKAVVRCKAKHNSTEAKKASEEDADGLEKEVLLAEGAKIMITRNVWTSKGLVNGAQGVVRKLWYYPGSNPRDVLPAVVSVECNEGVYSGQHELFQFLC
ncbi:hypothetical protein R3P38DRAFT_2519159, partial [Favolaschia claudopus]